MFIRVTNTHNLESSIRRATANLVEIDKKKVEVEKPVASVEKKPSNKKTILRKLCWVLLIIFISALIGLTAVGIHNQNEVNAINQLTDARLISYERMIYEVKKLGLLFQIHDDASYQLAKTSINFSDELRAKYFVSQHYSGNDSPEVQIEYQDIQYEITENDYVSFLMYIKRTQGTEVRQYVIQAEYSGSQCIYLGILN